MVNFCELSAKNAPMLCNRPFSNRDLRVRSIPEMLCMMLCTYEETGAQHILKYCIAFRSISEHKKNAMQAELATTCIASGQFLQKVFFGSLLRTTNFVKSLACPNRFEVASCHSTAARWRYHDTAGDPAVPQRSWKRE